jgi:hypothetical protein
LRPPDGSARPRLLPPPPLLAMAAARMPVDETARTSWGDAKT